jgi:hypothetical protein
MTRVEAATAVLALFTTLTGCGTTTKEADPTKSALVQGTNHPSTTRSAASATATPSPTGAGPRKFGSRFNYEDGLVVMVAKPVRFQPSEYAAVQKAPAYLSFKITIINGTGKRFDPVLFRVSVQSNDAEADAVFDMANDLKGPPSTVVLPKRQSSFKVGFGVQNPKDLVVQVTPGFEYSEAVFTN